MCRVLVSSADFEAILLFEAIRLIGPFEPSHARDLVQIGQSRVEDETRYWIFRNFSNFKPNFRF